MKKFWGNFLFGLAKLLDIVLSFLISVLSLAVGLVENVRQFFIPIIGCFGFTGFILLPLFNPSIIIFILILLIFPLLGRGFVSFLEYGKYVLTEYLYDKADYYRLGRSDAKNFSDYGFDYHREKMREEQEERERQQRAKAEYWENIFNEFFNQSGYGSYEDYRNSQNYGNYGYNQGGYQGYQNQQNTYNPFDDFKGKYEKACDTLGVPYETDEYEVKLAYRKMAKKYHPDINKAPDAKETFQKINAAYEFLSKENIERYNRMK